MSRLDARIFTEDFDPVSTILNELPLKASLNENDETNQEDDDDDELYERDEEVEFIERRMADIDQVDPLII